MIAATSTQTSSAAQVIQSFVNEEYIDEDGEDGNLRSNGTGNGAADMGVPAFAVESGIVLAAVTFL